MDERAARAAERLGVLARQVVAGAGTPQSTVDLAASHPDFAVVRTDRLEEYGVDYTLFRHRRTSAELLSIRAPRDDNKVFGVSFRTPPSDSTGVPHILEHSVLCGSRRYTTKEPFVTLLKGSLQTYLNAFTYPDRTVYPVASQNRKDFYNLVNVYLDAVFFPRAVKDPRVLAQEGWHVELETPDQPIAYVALTSTYLWRRELYNDAAIIYRFTCQILMVILGAYYTCRYKGVVYNEMKGAYSNPDALIARAAQFALFPNITYGVDSGGDPACITSLTYDTFCRFHASFYHPGNARLFFYGDDPEYERLSLASSFLSDAADARPGPPADSWVRWQSPFPKALSVTKMYPSTANSPTKLLATVNWVLNSANLTQLELLALALIDHLLLGTSASILQRRLTDSGLGATVIGGGLDTSLQQATFSIGLKGMSEEADVQKMVGVIDSCLGEIVKTGFHPDAIAASANSIEFSLREFNTGGMPRGLVFLVHILKTWNYCDGDTDPVGGLRFEASLAALRERVAKDSLFLKNIVARRFIQNNHRALVTLLPDQHLERRLAADEKVKMSRMKKSMTSADLQRTIEKTMDLKRIQAAKDSPADLATIPKLDLKDIDPKAQAIPLEIQSIQGATALLHDISTSGIIYVDVFCEVLPHLSINDVILLPLFSRLLLESGTSRRDRVALARAIGTVTGGISTATPIVDGATNSSSGEQRISHPETARLFWALRGKCTMSHITDLFSLFAEVLCDARLDSRPRAVEILQEQVQRLRSRISSAGHAMAASAISATFSKSGKISEKLGGLTAYRAAQILLKRAQSDKQWPSLLASLERVRRALLSAASGAVINLTSNRSIFLQVLEDGHIEQFLSKINAAVNASAFSADTDSSTDALSTDLLQDPISESSVPWTGFAIPSMVNYVGMGGQLFDPGEVIHGSVAVAGKLLRTGYLWNEIRVIGGAYGAFCQLSRRNGIFQFLSYRDPGLASTLKVFAKAGAHLFEIASTISDDEIASAITGTIGEIDSPQSPDQRGLESFRQWVSSESNLARQRFRDEVLSTTRRDLRNFGRRLAERTSYFIKVAFGSQQVLDEAIQKAELPHGHIVHIS